MIPWLYFLQEDEQLLIETFTHKYTVHGPRIFGKPTLHAVKMRRKGIALESTQYLRLRDTLTGELRTEIGPQLYFLKASEEVVEKQSAIALKKHQYVRLLDKRTGRIRVERGEALVMLSPTEEVIGKVSDGIVVDDDTAVLVRNLSTGELSLITEPQVFFPKPDEEILEKRTKIRHEDHQVVVIRDPRGQYVFRKGADAGRAFFLEPYCELVEFRWSTGIHKDKRSLNVTRLDIRPKFMWYEFDVRTKDNVELVVGVTFFWQIADAEKMVHVTDDAPGDLCSHARSRIIQAVSQVTLEQFLSSFNAIVREAVSESSDAFYAERGLVIHSVEVRQIGCKDAGTQQILMEIIQETTNRLNRLQKQQSENEVSLQKVQGDIQAEELRGRLIELQRQHTRVTAEADGEGEARKILTFLEVLGDQLTLTDKTTLFNVLRQQDKIEALSSGNARVFITPQNASLQLDVEA
jgi:regulator of protease activity HflC (stomatin/prohibitin superfamily)